jgi:hypothetical protein
MRALNIIIFIDINKKKKKTKYFKKIIVHQGTEQYSFNSIITKLFLKKKTLN